MFPRRAFSFRNSHQVTTDSHRYERCALSRGMLSLRVTSPSTFYAAHCAEDNEPGTEPEPEPTDRE